MNSRRGSPERVSVEILTGPLAGQVKAFPESSFSIGRDPDSGLRFDPRGDLAVSGRHARVFFHDGRWILEDLGSLNGTLLNGRVLSAPTPLRHEDRIQFGQDGPEVVFRVFAQESGERSRGDPKSHRPLLALVVVLSLALLAVGVLAFRSWAEGRGYAEQVRAMQGQIDSILRASGRTVEELQGRNQSLAEALSRSRNDIQSLRDELEGARSRGDSRQIEVLQVQLQEAQAALGRQQLAAAIDFEAIERANGRAVAKVFVDFGDEILTATAFSVRPNGTLITNRHVVAGPSGDRRPDRIAVQFAASRQVWPARVVAVSQTDDLAALKVDNIVGDVPTVSGFNQRLDTLQSGQAVAVIGFPLGGADPLAEGGGGFARTTMTAGVIGALSERVLQMDGYGVEGSSGSPVFDGFGEVVGVLYGGRVEDGRRTLFAVPVTRAADLLQRVY